MNTTEASRVIEIPYSKLSLEDKKNIFDSNREHEEKY